MKKKSKLRLSEGGKAKPQVKKINPFEIHINRKKYDVLGMKSKAERGLPGISRGKSLKKRKRTLLQEYKFKDKKNVFLDRRIGERDSAMTVEDKILARYTAERMKFHSKKSIYNLGDDEELTHRGQTLTEIEKFDDPKSEDEDDEDGKLEPEFVGDAHFGGGMFKKVEGESKSRKDLIDQLIAESIKRKAEKQKIRQQTIDLTQKLDSEWKELLPLVAASKKSKLDPENTDKKDDKFASYDILSRKLKFEARGKPSDRLKSEMELAKEEKEKLEKLEKDRLQRMLGDENVKKIQHRSADDMDDGFDLSREPELLLTYKDGVLNMEEKPLSSDSEDESNEHYSKHEKKGEESEEEPYEDVKEENAESGEDENPGDEESDDLSDLKESDESENELETQTMSLEQVKNKKEEGGRKEKLNENGEETEKLKRMEVELPYTFEIPNKYEDFEKMLRNHDSHFKGIIIERMIKCHHPSLKQEFKQDLDLLYTYLLQYLQDCASDKVSMVESFRILDILSPWLYDLTQWNPESCASGLLEVIKEKYQDFLKNPKCYPSIDVLIFLKLVSILFPTSDFRHQVVTPTLIFMQQMLFQCKVQSSTDLAVGLFITTLVLEYCGLSKRYAPEAINFLYGVLRLCHPKRCKIPSYPPFEYKSEESLNLSMQDRTRIIECSKMTAKDLIHNNSSNEFKINAVSLALNLLSKFCDFWNEQPTAQLIFEPFFPLLDVNQFNCSLKNKIEEIVEKIMKFKKENLKYLVLEKKKPKPLRLYEPNIEEVYSLKKFKPMGKKKTERAKLMHKYKREMKGALRELRRDRSFIANLKYKETVKSDMERQRKVREIFGAAAEQAGELNKIRRMKK